MTRRANARLAGFMFLFYIVVGLSHLFFVTRASAGGDTAARLASLAHNASLAHFTVLLTLLESLSAFMLGIGLYGLTRDQDRDLALVAFACRAAEGTINALSTVRTIGLMSIATATTPDPTTNAVAAALFKMGPGGASAFCFSIGSTVFCYLFLRARSIPLWLAWLGLVSSIIIVVGNSLDVSGFLRGPLTGTMWIPIAAFEIYFGVWLLITGAPAPARTEAVT